jgi:hypothetical protein
MQDKSFLQAVEDLHSDLSNDFQDTIHTMLERRTTVTKATSDIEDKKVRTIVTKTLIVGQIITLLTLLKNLRILDEAQHHEFKTYLIDSLSSQPYNN